MVLQPDEALQITGVCVAGCVLVLMIRRAEQYIWMSYFEFGLFSLAMLIVLGSISARQDSLIAKVGIGLAGLALVTYTISGILAVRKQRLIADLAKERSAQAHKMEAIGQLAGGVAHDFNNFLTVIIGNLDLHEEVDDTQLRNEFVNDARASAVKAAQVVEQLLQYARESDQRLRHHSADDLLNDILKLSQRLVPATIRIDITTPTSNLRLHVDESQFVTAIMNLITNAADAIESTGVISLSVERQCSSVPIPSHCGAMLSAGDYLAFTVTDTGTGISEDILSHILDPFYTTKNVGEGSGLGLSMVVGFARRSNGGVTIQTSEQGTSVTILLPSSDPQNPT